MPASRKTSAEKDYADLGYEVPVTDSTKKTPNWVNLAQLDGPLDDSLVNNLVYKVSDSEPKVVKNHNLYYSLYECICTIVSFQ